MLQEKISIIIPVFNGEAYLYQTIPTILAQSYLNIEIIFIEDGSSDHSLRILEAFKQADSRILLYSQKNSGVSVARNKGIELSTGKYICFIDADDCVDCDYVMRLHQLITSGEYDISMCNYAYLYDYNNIFHQPLDLSLEKKITTIKGNSILLVMHQCLDESFVVVWGKLYRKELFESLRFTPNQNWEDYEMLYQVFDQTTALIQTKEPLYFYYRNNENSATYRLKDDFFEDMILVLDKELVYMQNKQRHDIVEYIYKRYMYWLIQYFCLTHKKESRKKKKIVQRYRQLYVKTKKFKKEKMLFCFFIQPTLYAYFKKSDKR